MSLHCQTCSATFAAPDEAAGRRVTCPRCKSVTVAPAAASPLALLDLEPDPVPPRRRSPRGRELPDGVLYSDEHVEITKRVVSLDGTRYPVRNITSVTMGHLPGDSSGMIALGIILGVLVAVIGIGMAAVVPQALLATSFGVAIVIYCVYLYRSREGEWAIMIGSGGGERQAFVSSDRARIREIIAAIDVAISRPHDD